MRNLLTILLVLFTAGFLSAQTEENSKAYTWDVGVEIQAYPTGIIPAFAAELGIGDRNGLNFRIGVNIFDHRDLGVHDTETGRGPGFSLGYRRYFKDANQGLYAGLRADLWLNHVDWTDEIDPITILSGETDLVVVQPTAEAGYQFKIGDSFFLAPHAAFGWEWNAKTDGQETGEGAIILIGVRAQFRVK